MKVYWFQGAGEKTGLSCLQNGSIEPLKTSPLNKKKSGLEVAMKDQEGLLTTMERGSFTSTKVRNTKPVKANMVIFATWNSRAVEQAIAKPIHCL